MPRLGCRTLNTWWRCFKTTVHDIFQVQSLSNSVGMTKKKLHCHLGVSDIPYKRMLLLSAFVSFILSFFFYASFRFSFLYLTHSFLPSFLSCFAYFFLLLLLLSFLFPSFVLFALFMFTLLSWRVRRVTMPINDILCEVRLFPNSPKLFRCLRIGFQLMGVLTYKWIWCQDYTC